MDEVEDGLADPEGTTEGSQSSDRSITFGETTDGRYLAVVWETVEADPLRIYPVTAFDAPRPRRKRS